MCFNKSTFSIKKYFNTKNTYRFNILLRKKPFACVKSTHISLCHCSLRISRHAENSEFVSRRSIDVRSVSFAKSITQPVKFLPSTILLTRKMFALFLKNKMTCTIVSLCNPIPLHSGAQILRHRSLYHSVKNAYKIYIKQKRYIYTYLELKFRCLYSYQILSTIICNLRHECHTL